MIEEVNVREKLELYVPTLFELIKGQNISWKSINKKFIKVHNKRSKFYEDNDEYLIVEVNFYDLLTKVMKGESSSITFIQYFENVFNDLNKNLTPQGKILIGRTIRNLLTDFTLGYLHYLGELSVLNNLINKGKYHLFQVEHPLENGKSIDFRVVSNEDNTHHLVEVMNLHINETTPKDYEVLEKFLTGKIIDKYTDKTEGLGGKFDFSLVPVLWGSHEDLQPVVDFFKNGPGLKLNKVTEPFSYSCMIDEERSKVYFRFGKISTLFD